MRSLTAILVLLSLTFSVIPANAETITGEWETATVFSNTIVWTTPGGGVPALFGNLPNPGKVVTEVATITVAPWTGGALPIPVYSSDGSPADGNTEVFWVVQVEMAGRHPEPNFFLGARIEYTGGATASLSLMDFPPNGGFCFFQSSTFRAAALDLCASVTAVAIRTDTPLPVSETNMGRVKAMYGEN